MKTSRYILFKIADHVEGQQWVTRTVPGDTPSITSTLAEHYDSSGKPIPNIGYRIHESKLDPDAASFNHGDSRSTHYRLSPWKVTQVEEYLPNIEGHQNYTEVVICYCTYEPLPDEVNPWIEHDRSIVSPASFGWDRAAFDAFVQSMTDADKAIYQVVDPDRQPVTTGK